MAQPNPNPKPKPNPNPNPNPNPSQEGMAQPSRIGEALALALGAVVGLYLLVGLLTYSP